MHPIFERLETELSAALSGLDAAQTQLRPVAYQEKWSIQQIVTHLLLVYEQSAAAIEARIAKGRPTQARPTLANRFAQIVVTGIGFLPSGRNAPAAVFPAVDEEPRTGAELSAIARARLQRLDLVTRQAERLFGPARCITHMALGPMSIGQWRRFQLVHSRHHLKQVGGILRTHGI